MVVVEFTVKDRLITVDEETVENLVGDNADYRAHFTFDDEWNGETKTARFIKNGRYAEQILTDDICDLPVEVLKGGLVDVGVFSSTKATTGVKVPFLPSILEKDGPPADPTPDVYAQLTQRLDSIVTLKTWTEGGEE